MNWLPLISVVVAFAGAPFAQAGSLTYSHTSTALPGARGPAITLLSIAGTNDGSNYTFTLTFANSTIEGPSSGKADAVYGFINMDTDNKSATGLTGASLDAQSYESGFGRYSPSSLGVDAFINLGSEGDPLHGAPGKVDVVATNGFSPIDAVAITYSNQAGATPSTLKISIPLTDFSTNQISLLDTGNFSGVVGNVDNATDFLGPAAAVPEPGSLFLLALGVTLSIAAGARIGRRAVRHPNNESACWI